MKTSSKSAVYWASEFQKGNSDAFKYIFEQYYRSLCYYAGTILVDSDEIEDTVSEVFVKLWNRAPHFNNLQSIKGFLFICTKNLCLDRLKQCKRAQVTLNEYSYFTALQDDEDRTVLEAEVLSLIFEEIDLLPSKCKIIFKRIFFDGLKTDQIADQMGISVKTVRNQKARAISLLRASILKKGLGAFIYLFAFFDSHS